MTLFQGDTIDRYVIDGPLGAGGMGEVYRARDTRLQRNVALKILRAELAADPDGGPRGTGPTDGAARMLREARAAAALDHPNVVHIYDVGQIDTPGPLHGTTYLAMELIKGRALRDFVADPSVPMRDRVRWLGDVARALAAAHHAKLVHRDIKPDNVMVGDNGVVKVLDFGIARRAHNAVVDSMSATEGVSTGSGVGTMTAQGVVIGTPQYMAPEQMRGESLDGRADQFSWGVLAYELLTGAPPWGRGVDSLALVSQILSSKAPSLEPFADIPDCVKATVLRALEKDRDARFGSMAAVIEALEGRADPFAPTASKIATGKMAPAQPVTVRSADARGPALAQTEMATPPPRDASFVPPVPVPSPSVEAAGTDDPTSKPASQASKGRASTTHGAAITAMAIAVLIAGAAGWRATHRTLVAPASSAPAVVVPVVGCTSHSACVHAHGGEPWVCRASDQQCVAIASQDCSPSYEPRDLEGDDTVWIGAMFPLKGPLAATFGQMSANGVEMARKEIAGATKSLAGAGSVQHVRPVAVVLCDDSDDPMRAAKHLVDDVGVPGIVGFKSGPEVVDLAGGLLLKRGVLAVASLTPSPAITKVPQPEGQPRMIWRTTYGLDGLAAATAALTPAVLAQRGERGVGSTRVALIRAQNGGGDAFAEAFFKKVVFNGKSAVANGRDYAEFVLDQAAPSSNVAATAAAVVAFAPSIIVTLVYTENVSDLASAIDAAWTSADRPRPIFIAANESTRVFDAYIGARAERRHRVFTVESSSETAENARFVFRYNATFAGPVTRSVNPSTSYDALYLVAFATFGSGTERVTGLELAKVIARLQPPGAPVEVGPSNALEAIGALSTGHRIDLRGSATGLDFDLTTGEPSVDFALLCAAANDRGGADGDLESGLVFRASGGGVAGQIHCP